MGKVRRQRSKLHLEAKNSPLRVQPAETEKSPEFTIKPTDNLFAGLDISLDNLSKKLNDDTASVKSFKSVKSESGRILSKKEKLKLRREMLLNKFQLMHEKQLKKKQKQIDLNPLKDALPSLETLLKSRTNINYQSPAPSKRTRGIDKTRVLKRKQLERIKVFQRILKNKSYQNNPQQAITQHVEALLKNKT